MHIKQTLITGLFLSSITTLSLAASPLEQASSLMEQGKAQQTFELLRPLEDDYAGTPDFDYLFGMAALDIGQISLAVMALERVLAVNPNHLAAKASIARAYLLLGEKQAAEKTFQQVKQAKPSPEITKSMQRYLDLLGQDVEGKSEVSIWGEATFGFDSNINTATSSNSIFVPAFAAAVALSPSNQSSDDWFIKYGGGVRIRHALNANNTLISRLSVNNMQVQSTANHQFETSQLNANIGISHTLTDNENLTGSVIAEKYNVSHQSYRNMYGVKVAYLKNLDATSALNLSGQALRLNYTSQSIRDANRYVLATTYAKQLNGKMQPTVILSGSVGTEDILDSTQKHLGHNFAAARIGSSLQLNPDSKFLASLHYQHKNYDGTDPSFLISRKDKQLDISLKLEYSLDKNTKITPQIRYTRNNSNVALNDYDRTVATVNVRYTFD